MFSKLTIHVQNERSQRFEYIENTVGFGDIIFTKPNYRKRNIECITNTGIVIIKTRDGCIITAFIGGLQRVSAMYRKVKAEVPEELLQTVINNRHYYFAQNMTIEERTRYFTWLNCFPEETEEWEMVL